MEYLLVAGGVGAVIGFTLGVLATAIFRATHEDSLPTPRACAYPNGECLAAQKTGIAF